MIRYSCLIVLLMMSSFSGGAQSFSQYHFSPLLLNPAWAGATTDLRLAAHYRHQQMQELTVQRVAATLMSPIRWGGRKRLGIGLHFLNDRAEELSRFSVQEMSGTLAYHQRLPQHHYLSVGGQASYQQGSLGLGNVTTGSQWVAHRGFNSQTGINESFTGLRQSTYHLSVGGLWYQERSPGAIHHYVGVAAQQLNRSSLHWLDNPARGSIRYTAQAGWQAFRKDNLSITPEALWWWEAGQQYLNAGATLSYHFQDDNPFNPIGDGTVSLVTRHTVGESITLGVQLEQPRFVAGFAYDWGAGSSLEPGFQATEYGIVLRRSLFRKKKEKVPAPIAPLERTFSERPTAQSTIPTRVNQSADTLLAKKVAPVAADSTQAITPQRKRAFVFAFNETALNEDTRRYLQDVVGLLEKNPHLLIRVVGHTDDVGTATANQVVSQRRAATVRDFLIAQGVAPGRIQALGKGETEPLLPNDDATSRAKNRRIEIELYTR